MAFSDKDILITPNTGNANADPSIQFVGANANTSTTITATMYDSGSLSFEGNSGQLFSITDSLTGTIFSVNDISGIPSIEVDDDGSIRLAHFGGNISIGQATANVDSVIDIAGNIAVGGNLVISSKGEWLGAAAGLKGEKGDKGSTGAKGEPGVKGDKGSDGNFGGATFDYTFSTSTTNSDPGTGTLRFNSLTISSATQMYIDDTDDNATDIQTFLRTIDDSTSTIKGHFRVSNRLDASDFALFVINSIVEQTGYFQVNCTHIDGSATGFSNGEDIIITFARTGDVGDKGLKGEKGQKGQKGTNLEIGYQTTLTSNTTVVSGDTIIADSSGGSFTITLPLSPATGDVIRIADGANTAANPVTVARNGNTIEGIADDLIIDVENSITDLVYDGTTWQVYVTGVAGAKGEKGQKGIKGDIGPTGTNLEIGYQTTLTANATASAGNTIIADSSGGSFTITLPAAPTSGDAIRIADGANTAANPITVARNGNTIEGIADDLIIDVENSITDLVYNGTTWQVYVTGVAGAKGEKGQKGDNLELGYNTTLTANATVSAGNTIIANTVLGTFTITLPASPATGDAIRIADGGDFGANNLVIARNGSTIEGVADDLLLDVAASITDLVYDGNTWQVYVTGVPGEKGSAATTLSSNTQVLYDKSGNITGSPGFVFDDTSNAVTVNGTLTLSATSISANDRVANFVVDSNSVFSVGSTGIYVDGYNVIHSSTVPATRSDGSTLQTGDRWYDVSDCRSWMWNGSDWVSPDVKRLFYKDKNGSGFLFGVFTTSTETRNMRIGGLEGNIYVEEAVLWTYFTDPSNLDASNNWSVGIKINVKETGGSGTITLTSPLGNATVAGNTVPAHSHYRIKQPWDTVIDTQDGTDTIGISTVKNGTPNSIGYLSFHLLYRDVKR